MAKGPEFPFIKAKSTLGNEASAAVSRKLWLLVELIRRRNMTYAEYARIHERDRRTFQRDLQQLRALGETSGFKISGIKEGERVDLISFEPRLGQVNDEQQQLIALVQTIVATLGQPIARKLKPLVGPAGAPQAEEFYRFAMPKLLDESRAAEIARILERAWSNGPARVRFRYMDSASASVVERTVEPYRLLLRSGVFYLVGYDCGKRGWRMFALDRFDSRPVPCGSALKRREVPPEYDGSDTLGFIKRDGAMQSVTVELSPLIATSAISRSWQKGQRVQRHSDGSASITFEVSDAAEIVRWALGFGAQACVVAPPAAVQLARETIEQIAVRYAAASRSVGDPAEVRAKRSAV
jgi:predicted DNA-binding transcriptional regulator YafY